jgi:hypothetical protein
MWTLFVNNQIISHKVFEWLKFIELSMAMVLRSVEDERCFFTFSFIKKQVEKSTSHTFELGSAYVCTKK